MNKVRAEVDPEAELIIGAITDPSLDGKMRVSIVATALDGQQPESKSVINMVHRIQNRNPGYSDFAQASSSTAGFNIANSMPSTVVDGANALKVDHEINNETNIENDSSHNVEDTLLQTQEVVLENKDEETNALILENEHKEEEPNGLENFQIQEETPELFNSDDSSESNDQVFSSFVEEKDENKEEDDLEIPAFLRRQKN